MNPAMSALMRSITRPVSAFEICRFFATSTLGEMLAITTCAPGVGPIERVHGLDRAVSASVGLSKTPERVNDFETPFVMRLASKRV
jgi:hypothetical protein